MTFLKDLFSKFFAYNLVGWLGFALSTVVYYFLSGYQHWLAWFLANFLGGTTAFFFYYFKVNIHRRTDPKGVE